MLFFFLFSSHQTENEEEKNKAENERENDDAFLTDTAKNICEKTLYFGTASYTLLNVYMLIDNLLYDGSVFQNNSYHYLYRVLNMMSIFIVSNAISIFCYRHESSYYRKVRKYALSMLAITVLSFAYFPIIDMDNTNYPRLYKFLTLTTVTALYVFITKESFKDKHKGLFLFALFETLGFINLCLENVFQGYNWFIFIASYKTFTIIGMVIAAIYYYRGKLFK